MVSFRSSLQLSFAALASAKPFQTTKLQWGACNTTEVPAAVPVECSLLHVPLDYTQPNSNETLVIDLVRVPAPVQPSKGSIIINFGGPGGTGRDTVSNSQIAQELQAMSGRQYDLLSFDPRGTSGSRIPMDCFESEAESWFFLANQKSSNQSEGEIGRLWAQGTINAETCLRTQNKTGSLISSAFTARDIMGMVDALQEDGMLRYWGFSYGTTLGATLAAMFPDRVEKMILDGVQNPHEYYHEQADIEEWTDADAEFSTIFTACVAARENCALATGNNKTAAELQRDVWDLLHATKTRPIAVGHYLMDYTATKSLIVSALYDSIGWPSLAFILNALLTRQFDGLADLIDSLYPTDPVTIRASMSRAQALAGIHCGDNMVRTEKFEDFLPVVDRMYNKSKIMGDALMGLYSTCAQWKIEPKERYTGDFNVKTKNPVLFVGNTFDGLTPLVSAKNVSSTFDGSVVLVVDGYGHASLAVPSVCTIKTTSAYWLDGTLPPNGKVCESDAPLYSGVTWDEIIDRVYGNGTTTTKRHTPVSSRFRNPLSIW
ncbi:hypothetical protein AAE478_010091 [Parahypoxylon ruwenzoriense]